MLKFWIILKIVCFFGIYALQLALLISLIPWVGGRWLGILDLGEAKLFLGAHFLITALAQYKTAAWRARMEVLKEAGVQRPEAVARHLRAHRFLAAYLGLLGASGVYWAVLQLAGKIPAESTFELARWRAALLAVTFAGALIGAFIKEVGKQDGATS